MSGAAAPGSAAGGTVPSAVPGRAAPDLAPPPSCLELFTGFMRVAAFSFGGVLPWARFVLVERRRWLSADEFTDVLALCQLLPGPNIVNVSVAVGARFHGPLGSVSALAGLTGLPIAIVLAVATAYASVAGVPAVERALGAMAAAAAGLVVAMALKIGEPILRKRFRAAAPFVVATFVAVGLLRYPLWPVILVLAPLAILYGWRTR